MRDILFRGKRVDNGEWVYGHYVKQYGVEQIYLPNGVDEDGFDYHHVIPQSVGQYTGLTDKNGKRIFEGDIVTGLFLFGMEIKSVIAFRYGAFGLQWYRGDVEEFSAFTSICNVQYEVIGNIHDNPELIGKDDTNAEVD